MPEEKEDPRLLLALSRYQAISSLVADPPAWGTREQRLRQLAEREWPSNNGTPFQPKSETLRKWVRRYQRGGFKALFDKERPKGGVSILAPEVRERAIQLKRAVPERSLERIAQILEQERLVEVGVVTRSTLHRVLRAAGVSAGGFAVAERKDLDRFEADAPNDLWQSDMLCGPWLPNPLKKPAYRRAWLFAFLDDHSRWVPAAWWDFREDLPVLERTFRTGLCRGGIPKRAYFDNGGVYRAHHVRQIAACLGMEGIIFTRPRRPMGHGKIEAFNRQVRRSFLSEVRDSGITTIAELNEAFSAWLDREYHPKVHSETGETPLQRWKRGSPRWADEDALRQAFAWREQRTPDKSGVLSLYGIRYQVGAEFARRRIELRFDPDALDVIEVWVDGRFRERARPLNIEAWRRPKRPESSPEPTGKPAAWLTRLVEKWKTEKPTPPPELPADPAADLLELLRDHVDPECLDAAAVRAFVARSGPFDLDRAAEIFERLAHRHPRDLHVNFWLEQLLEGGR